MKRENQGCWKGNPCQNPLYEAKCPNPGLGSWLLKLGLKLSQWYQTLRFVRVGITVQCCPSDMMTKKKGLILKSLVIWMQEKSFPWNGFQTSTRVKCCPRFLIHLIEKEMKTMKRYPPWFPIPQFWLHVLFQRRKPPLGFVVFSLEVDCFDQCGIDFPPNPSLCLMGMTCSNT